MWDWWIDSNSGWRMIGTRFIHARGYEEQCYVKMETGGLFEMMDNSTLFIPEATKNKVM